MFGMNLGKQLYKAQRGARLKMYLALGGVGLLVVIILLTLGSGFINKLFERTERNDLIGVSIGKALSDTEAQALRAKVELLEDQNEALIRNDKKHRRELDARKKQLQKDKELLSQLTNDGCMLTPEQVEIIKTLLENHDIEVPGNDSKTVLDHLLLRS